MMTKMTFTYGAKKYVHLALCVFLVGMLAFIFATGKLREGDWALATIFWSILLLGCSVSLSVFLDVVISDDGVCKPFYGLPGRHL
jgi:hypothetical protein